MTDPSRKWPRLYVSGDLAPGVTISATKEQSHYLSHVLRLKSGEKLRLFNGQNGEWQGNIAAPKKNLVIIQIDKQIRTQNQESQLWLCCAPIKRAHFDFMVMKATELGVSHIAPILTARTQVREVNIERCTAIAVEAAEQSERLSIPQISAPVTLGDLIIQWPAMRLPIVCAEFGEAKPVQEAFANIPMQKFDSCAVITGPEGGFTEDELDQLLKLPNAVAIRLGPRILRADTAALSALSCWQAMCGDWK